MHRREFLRDAFLGSASAAIAASAPGQTAPSRTTSRDLLLLNADIITLDPRRPSASAALVRGGRIVMVGDRRDVQAQAQNATELDAGGRVVIPGFVDNHCHVEDSCVVGDHQPTLRGATSIAEMVEKIRSVAATVPKGEWVLLQAVASSFPDNVSEKRWLNRHDLDEATREHPVMVILGIHASILNTVAWKRTGYWEPKSDETVKWTSDGTPRRGSFIHRDAKGNPSGLATEVWDFRPGYSVDQYKESMRRHFKEWFLSKGLTSIVTIQDTAPSEFLALQELQAEGGLPARLRVYPVVPHAVALQDLVRVGWRSGFGDEMFRFGGVKFFVDGIGSDYMGRSVTDLKWTLESLTDALVGCQRGGLQAILHAVTEGGWDLAVKSLEAAKTAAPGELRHRIDHRTPADDERIQTAKSLGLTLGITAPRQKPGAAAPAGAFARSHRYRTLVENEMAIAVLDAAGPGGSYHPMQGIANMVTERSAGGAAPAGEAVTFEDALRMWTLWPARNNSEDHEKGSIEVGKLGDFAVLSADPRGRPAEEIHAIETVTTIVGGDVVFDSR